MMVGQELMAFPGSFEASKDAARPAVGKGIDAGWARRNSGRENRAGSRQGWHAPATVIPRVSH